MAHIPVLTKEVIKYLDPKPNENFVDCTFGQGGHSRLILEKNGPEGKVLGIDLDKEQIEKCELEFEKYKNRMVLVQGSYAGLTDIVEKKDFKPISGILLDLGMSSEQLENSRRGFTFQKNELLDMRYDNKNQNLTAEEIINKWSREEVEKIFKEYGEEKFAKQITNKIIEDRKTKKIKSTFELVEIIKNAVPARFQHGKIHCATRVFQALRIAVNGELNNLKKVLPQIISVLSPGGRMAIISFHSLEDRIVKNFFKEEEKNKTTIKILTKKPIEAEL